MGKPFSEIHVGDVYASLNDPQHGISWEVIDKNAADKLIKIRALIDNPKLRKELWVNPVRSVFNGELIIQGPREENTDELSALRARVAELEKSLDLMTKWAEHWERQKLYFEDRYNKHSCARARYQIALYAANGKRKSVMDQRDRLAEALEELIKNRNEVRAFMHGDLDYSADEEEYMYAREDAGFVSARRALEENLHTSPHGERKP